MNASPIPAMIAAVLFFAVVLLVRKGMALASEVPMPSNEFIDDGSEIPPCPPEFISRVFSADDAKYVSGTQSEQLVRLFRSERKAVALVWVRQMSAAIQRTMRKHTSMARGSDTLELVTEVKLFLRFGELMLFCGALFVAIRCVGPAWLGRMAVYVDAHSQRLAGAQQSFRAATSSRDFPRVGAA